MGKNHASQYANFGSLPFPVIVSLTTSCAERETAHKKPIAQTIRTLVLLAIQSKQRLS